jgi:hypothetical protein
MRRPRLFIFNPETDYALASDSEFYTPPAKVVALRRANALMPVVFAAPGDAILLLDSPAESLTDTPRYHEAFESRLHIATMDDVQKSPGDYQEYVPTPWGWNRQIRRTLIETIGDMSGMPDCEALRRIRELSHRRTTTAFMKACRSVLDNEIEIPVEITDPAEGVTAFKDNRGLFFKAPWSSSGRGILLTDDLEEKHVEPWLRGIISRQGSVMMEKAYDRKLDFATEWLCEDGEVKFIGYSVFNVSRRGKYHGNVKGSQTSLRRIIEDKAGQSLTTTVECQREAISTLIAPDYDGPVGIDMLVTASGAINPCVEINLRHTMGMAGILKY